MIELTDRLYTSTEVAEILGVSLRSVYRYLEEDKLQAEVKTATGRHRFTKKNILDFLYPEGAPQTSQTKSQKDAPVTLSTDQAEPVQDISVSQVTEEVSEEAELEEGEIEPEVEETSDEVDWLEKFRQASQKFREEASETEVKQEEDSEEEIISEDEDVEQIKEESEEIEEELEEDEEPIDWLAKFREAAKKFKEEEAAKTPGRSEETEETKMETKVTQEVEVEKEVKYSDEPAFAQKSERVSGIATKTVEPVQQVKPEKEETTRDSNLYYYKSDLGGLKDIAQSIDKSSRNSNVEYAFTMNAGLSLFKPIKPFSMLHVYIQPSDREFFEKMLKLKPSSEDDAQLCLILSNSSQIFDQKIEMHGLNVVSKNQLLKDVKSFEDAELYNEAQSILS